MQAAGLQERLRQTIVILRKLTEDLGLPYESPEIQTIKDRMSEFTKTGEPWKGVIPLEIWDREAVLECRANGKIELTLRQMLSQSQSRTRH